MDTWLTGEGMAIQVELLLGFHPNTFLPASVVFIIEYTIMRAWPFLVSALLSWTSAVNSTRPNNSYQCGKVDVLFIGLPAYRRLRSIAYVVVLC